MGGQSGAHGLWQESTGRGLSQGWTGHDTPWSFTGASQTATETWKHPQDTCLISSPSPNSSWSQGLGVGGNSELIEF